MRFTFYLSAIITLLCASVTAYFMINGVTDEMVEKYAEMGEPEAAAAMLRIQLAEYDKILASSVVGVLALCVAIAASLTLRSKAKEKAPA